MSIELPEAIILARQMNEVLIGKKVSSYDIIEYERLQRVGFINKNIKDFDRLIGQNIKNIISRGNVIVIKLSNEVNILLGMEYGGTARFHDQETSIPKKRHLKIVFTDNTSFSVRLTGMGVLQVLTNNELPGSYVFKRDHLEKISPIDDENYTLERFSRSLQHANRMLKSIIVGKDAIVTGFGNSAFQEIIYLAKLHPKRKALSLDSDERKALYEAINEIVENRINKGGKSQFTDLFGIKGKYQLLMGSHVKVCPSCQVEIEKLAISGGTTYYCPNCQNELL
jgi:formamidopyrimidine-DNA glycosylase